MANEQLELPLPCDAAQQLARALAAGVECSRLRCRISPAACLARQRSTDYDRDDYCVSGQCKLGVAVLLGAGLLSRHRCPMCEGKGWIPADADVRAWLDGLGEIRGAVARDGGGCPNPRRGAGASGAVVVSPKTKTLIKPTI